MRKNLVTGGVMQLSNDTSKNSTSPPYLVKNERSLNASFCRPFWFLLDHALLTPEAVSNAQLL